MPNTRTAPRKTARRIARRITPTKVEPAVGPSLRYGLAHRVFRIATMLRFQAQALVEIRYIRRVGIPKDQEDGIRAEDLEEGFAKGASALRSLSSTIIHLGAEMESIDSEGRTLAADESPAPIADTYLDRAASAARGGADTFP
jgi:hypothetical protein